MKLGKWMVVVAIVAGLGAQAEDLKVGLAMYCDNEIAQLEGALVFSSVNGQGLSCETVYVAPRKGETTMLNEIYTIDIEESCQTLNDSIAKQNALLDQVVALTAQENLDMAQIDALIDQVGAEKAKYDKKAVEPGGVFVFYHKPSWKKDLERIAAANPNKVVKGLPIQSAKLNTGLACSSMGLSAEDYLKQVPAYLGADINGKVLLAWDNVAVMDLPDFSIDNSGTFVAERHTLSSACVRRNEDKITSTTMSLELTFEGTDYNAQPMPQKMTVPLSNL